jgi:hypothetical protein
MRSRRVTEFVLTVLLAAFARPAAPLLAHHSFAMFDTANEITLTGVVTSLQWTNPHVYIELDVVEAPGNGAKPLQATGAGAKHWSIELGSPSILQRAGWKFNTIKKGDKITAVVSPLRNGEPGSLLTRITMADGRVLTNGGATGVGGGVAPATPPRKP